MANTLGLRSACRAIRTERETSTSRQDDEVLI